MGRTKAKMSADLRAHLAMRRRGERLRAKERKGTINEEERRELAAMPALKRGRKPKMALDADRAGPQSDEQSRVSPEAGESAPPDDAASPPPPPPRPEPEAPPPIDVLPRSGDWRSRYRGQIGREATCLEVAGAYCGLLKRMAAFVESCGTRPVFDAAAIDRQIFPAAVLTVDKLLPADFEMGPEAELAISSGVVMGQAWIVARRHKAAQKTTAPPSAPWAAAPPTPAPPAPPAPPEEPSAPPDSNGKRPPVVALVRPPTITPESIF